MTNRMGQGARGRAWTTATGWIVACALSVAGAACGSSDPDGNSGGDAYRSEAAPMPLDELTTGEIGGGGDATDWKSVDVTDAGKVTVQFATDNKGTGALIGVYDKYGELVTSEAKKGGSEDSVKIKFKAAEGRYFVKIQHKGGPKTTYSVQASMGDGGGGGAVPDI